MVKKQQDDRVYLREWRLAKGLTQPELARRVGTVKSEVSRLEKGSRRMTIEWMSSFAKALGVSVEDLMTVPPIGFGAVSPPPKRKGDNEAAAVTLGDISLEISGGGHAATSVNGDDWSGTFGAGDVLIYDTTKRSTAAPGLMAFDVGGDVIVRRVTPGPEGATLTCSNPAYPPMPLSTGNGVLGRVVARLHRV